MATGLSVLVLGLGLLRGSTELPRLGATVWQVIAFYFGAGVIGGAVFGLLRPMRNRYLGRYLSAYLVLFLVYGGITAVFYESLSRRHAEPVPPRLLLVVWAGLCLVLAPLYVYGFRDQAD